MGQGKGDDEEEDDSLGVGIKTAKRGQRVSTNVTVERRISHDLASHFIAQKIFVLSGHWVLSPVRRLHASRPSYLTLEIAGIKLLGFKDRDELRFEDNIKHSHFIYPNEMVCGTLLYAPYLCDLIACSHTLVAEGHSVRC